MMNTASKNPGTVWIATAVAVLCTAFLTAGCGGGGGGGGGASPSLPSGGDDGITLASITFPQSTDLTGATTIPPNGAPLAQQVIFTFSGIPDGPDRVDVDLPPGYDAIQIYAVLDEDYDGPEVVADRDRNVIPARGTYEKNGNVIVFTPFFPTEPLDLGRSAPKEAVPGLLPDMEYVVFVPVGIGGSITNLTGVDGAVSNPVRFKTFPESLTGFFFRNHPAEIPRVVDLYPADGDVDVPVNTCAGNVPGFPAERQFFLEFDQPLDFSEKNIAGEDLDGDGLAEENIYLQYTEPEAFAALDSGTSRDPAVLRVDRRTGLQSLVGVTRLGVSPFSYVGLNSIVVGGDGFMLGSSGSTLYTVEYRDLVNPQVCRLFLPRDLGGRTDVRGLELGPDGVLYAVDGDTGSLLTVDKSTGDVSVLAELGSTSGGFKDLAVKPDGTVYALAVRQIGVSDWWSTVERIDLDSDPVAIATLFSGPGNYTSISMHGSSRASLYTGQGLAVEILDLGTGVIVPEEGYEIAGGLDEGAPLNIDYSVAELGVWVDLVSNSYKGSRVILEPSGILPFGERIELMVRRGLDNINNGSIAVLEGQNPAEADRLAEFRTFDPGPAVIADVLFEDFLDKEWEGDPIRENPSLPPANWAVQDVDGMNPEYSHLLATYGLGGDGGLGDFKPLGIYPTVILDTDFQVLPLFDGSTPGVTKQTVVQGGIFNFRDIVIPAGVTVVAVGSNPLIFTATGRIEIAGTIDVSGKRGSDDVTFNSAFTPVPGGLGGPGGGRGGVSNPALPEDFRLLTDLRSPQAGERGWGYSNLRKTGGKGGESGADGTDVKYLGSDPDPDSFGAGGGGGSFFQQGSMGYHGAGRYGADPFDPNRYVLREPWDFYDGHPFPTAGVNQYTTTAPMGGDAGEWAFADGDDRNNFVGSGGELASLRGGQGGGGGGSRLDSMNPATIGLAAGFFPPIDRSAYDAKGGGGGGGGGALGLYALGEVVVESTGSILARGGDGGGGEVIGHSNFGGGAGGGSGGAVIIDSAARIRIKAGGVIDVSGGWPGEGKEVTKVTVRALEDNPCLNGGTERHRASFCSWSVGDGGYGGYGLVQLQVADPAAGIEVDDWNSIFARVCAVDWFGPLCTGNDPVANPHCGCNANPPNPNDPNCAYSFWHFKVNYDAGNNPSFPITQDCLVDPSRTPTTLGPLSYGLSKWIDLGQVVHREPVAGLPAPRFLGFAGIDTITGNVVTQNGFIPSPGSKDIEVYAPDWNNGTPHFIPDQNEVTVEFQGADPVTPGSKVPDPATMTAWTADIESLSGKQFVRFRIGLDTAKAPFGLTASNPKPQVNFVRIRMEY